MSNRASFIFGRALPLGVFGFLVAIQGQLAFAAIQHALTHGDLDRAGAMYLVNRVLTVAFFGFLVAIYAVRSRAIAKDHNPVAIVAALTGSFVLYGLFLIPGRARSTNLWVLAGSDLCLASGLTLGLCLLTYRGTGLSPVPLVRGVVPSGP